MQIKRILMPTDFSSCADAALEHALFLAAKHDATLYLLHVLVVDEDEPVSVEDSFPAMDAIHQRMKERTRGGDTRADSPRYIDVVEIQEDVRRSVAAGLAIVDHATEHDIDLIVIGTHGRRGLRRFLVGSVAEEVVRTAPCDVLTIRDREHAERLERPERILVPFDFSAGAEASLEVATGLAREYDARLDLVHVISPPLIAEGHGVPMPSWAPMEMARALVEELDQRLAAVATRCQATSHLKQGNPGPEILDCAEEHASDLIVIGRHGGHASARWLLGSVAERVVRGASCPVLVIQKTTGDADETKA